MTCKICNNTNINKVDLELNNSISSDNKFYNHDIIHFFCKNCGSIFISEESQIEYDTFYSNNYDFLTDTEDEEPVVIENNETTKYCDRLIEIFHEYIHNSTKKSFLDIGAGKGNFINALHNRFTAIQCHALEPSKSYSLLKNKTFLKSHHNKFFTPENFKNQKFDYVSLIGVLEHIQNPVNFLKSINDIINDDSILFIEVPNFENNKSDLLTIDHLLKFTERSLENLFNLSGFSVLKKDVPNTVPMQFIVKKGNFKKIKHINPNEEIVNKSITYINSVINDAKSLSNEEIAIYGQGLILNYLTGCKILKINNIKCVIDDNVLYQDKKWKNEIPIISYSKFHERNYEKKIFLAMNDCYHKNVINKLGNHKIYGTIK